MKKAILMLFVLGFVSMNGYAQKVYKKKGKVYLECTVASGMPDGSVTTTVKCKDGTTSNSAFRGGSTNTYAWENDKVFEKLEIDASDLNNTTMDWKSAYDGCKDKNAPGVTGWRLPTQREFMLMYIFRVPLGSMTGNNFGSYNYWSSSEKESGTSWYINFSYGTTGYIAKTNTDENRVRCVREVTPPAIGDLMDNGVVYWIDPDNPMKCKVLSLDLKVKHWSAKNTYELGVNGQDLTDGRKNVATMKAYSKDNTNNGDDTKKTTGNFATDFPAAGFCDAKNTGGVTGWYLPAKEELKALRTAYIANRTVIEATINANGGKTSSDTVWSSSESKSDTSKSWRINTSNTIMSSQSKTSNIYARCVKEVTP